MTTDVSNLFIISGPSGAGEDSIIDGVRQALPNVHVAVTTTTRAPREGESDGHPYYFISKEAFRAHIAAGDMAEWAQHYNDNYYGVTKAELARVQRDGIGIWKIDYKGVAAAKKMFPGIIAIFIMAESLEVLEQRIRSRGDVSEAYIAERMAYTREWLTHTDLYDYTVINETGKLDHAIARVVQIIRAHSTAA